MADHEGLPPAAEEEEEEQHHGRAKRRFDWKTMLKSQEKKKKQNLSRRSSDLSSSTTPPTALKWNMGMLNTDTEDVPGSVLLLSKVSVFNEPLGTRNAPRPTSTSSFAQTPAGRPSSGSSGRSARAPPEKKKSPDGKFVLEPQPDDSLNDPLNWPTWRRDAALLSLGFYCMLGGGMTPILAAGFNNVAQDFGTSEPRVALTTGLFMMGLGLGSVVLSPTAILYGKRPVYLFAAICFVLTSVWCALSPNFPSLVCARIFQGFAVSSVECLPSATVAEIYFLHEKAYRLGIYTLLLLSGKNLVPLVSAAIIQSLSWRWVFWIVAMIVGFAFCLLLVFVPETFWDRTPVPNKQRHRSRHHRPSHVPRSPTPPRKGRSHNDSAPDEARDEVHPPRAGERHAHFAVDPPPNKNEHQNENQNVVEENQNEKQNDEEERKKDEQHKETPSEATPTQRGSRTGSPATEVRFDAPYASSIDVEAQAPLVTPLNLEGQPPLEYTTSEEVDPRNDYTKHHSTAPPKTWRQQLRPYSGRLSKSSWIRVMVRPFLLFLYPAILWAALVYSLSIGWLIVLSESVTAIYKSRDTYNFTSFQAGLIYISPFIGGVLGTAVAGKLSDVIVRWMARKNGGVYEPEFRLVMAIPMTITTVMGLMGYGWSVAEKDAWIVPTIFFGFISFGCSLGSTTGITFAVDSYRQYAGEALVTLNFSKNIFHGLVFSLFFNDWLKRNGSKEVFIAIGLIHLALMMTTVPMYIYGKKARLWTVQKNFMEKF